MKYFRFLSGVAITIILVILLNSKHGILPPVGKFLDPFQGFWQNAEQASGWKNEECKLTGLKDEVKVFFDDRLVPHVFTKNDEDLYFMQGYITAKFRLWQMEIQTANAAGRVSEIVGEKALDIDRMQRRIGLVYGAEEAQKYIDKDTASKKLITAYCNGVNAYIKSLKAKDYPVEYKLLDYAPEEWTPIKVGLLLKNMANMLSVFEYDIENTNFVAKYGMEEFRKLYPDFIDAEDPIIPKGTPWGFNSDEQAPMQQSSPSIAMEGHSNEATLVPDPRSQVYANALPKPDDITGSNNWAVAGSKTASGKPILCNDPHLALSLPSIWYEMQLVSPNMNVYGATLPGSPAVIIGFNDSISWGVTNGGRDVRDWYRLKFKDAGCNEYEYKGQWLKAEKKIERFKVRGQKDFVDTVIYTRFGPVVFDKSFGEQDSRKYLAEAWTANLPSNEFKTFYIFNCAKNYDDYLKGLSSYTCPSQNFVFASRSGDIAIKEQGRFAIRDKATEQGKYVCDGTSDKDEWKTYIPYDKNPLIKNPARGFVSSANQHPTDTTYPYYYPGYGQYETYRNRRINKLLTEGNNIDVAFMKKMQNDCYNLHASEALPVLLSLLDRSDLTPEEKKIIATLEKWDFYNNANEIAPVYFEIWWTELWRTLWDEMEDKDVPMKLPSYYVTVEFLKNDSTSQFYDNHSTPEKETRHDIVLKSFKTIVPTLKAKEFVSVEDDPVQDESETRRSNGKPHDWGSYKATKIAHLSRVIDAFGVFNVYNGGGRYMINATNTSNGPSWRMIVDEGAMKAYVVYPGGESGNPGSPFYDNGIKVWAKGDYYEANFVKNGEELGGKKLFEIEYKP